jgi:hypothetical protein
MVGGSLDRDRRASSSIIIILGMSEIHDQRWDVAIEELRVALETSGGHPS